MAKCKSRGDGRREAIRARSAQDELVPDTVHAPCDASYSAPSYLGLPDSLDDSRRCREARPPMT